MLGNRNKFWCCLDHLDLSFTTLSFVFYAQPLHVSFLVELCSCSLSKKNKIFLTLFTILFDIFIAAGTYELGAEIPRQINGLPSAGLLWADHTQGILISN